MDRFLKGLSIARRIHVRLMPVSQRESDAILTILHAAYCTSRYRKFGIGKILEIIERSREGLGGNPLGILMSVGSMFRDMKEEIKPYQGTGFLDALTAIEKDLESMGWDFNVWHSRRTVRRGIN